MALHSRGVATRPRTDCSSMEGHTSLSTVLVSFYIIVQTKKTRSADDYFVTTLLSDLRKCSHTVNRCTKPTREVSRLLDSVC